MDNKSDRYEDRGNFFPDISAINKLSENVTKKSYIESETKVKKINEQLHTLHPSQRRASDLL